jgi:hypothetical protein
MSSATTGEGVQDSFTAIISRVAKAIPYASDVSHAFSRTVRMHDRFNNNNYDYLKLLFQRSAHDESYATTTVDWL